MSGGNSIVTPDDGACAFCAYLRGSRPYTFVQRDESVAVLVTREQRGSPHLLVLPVRHFETILDINDQEAADVMIAVRQAAKAIETVYGSSGIAVWQNNGLPAGQAIGHLHFHVAGTLENGGTEWGKVREISLDATEAIAIRIRAAFEL